MNKKIISILMCMIIMFYLCPNNTYAATADEDMVYFDEQGRLVFEMTDNRAINVAYKTIAWTLKKYNLPIDDPNNLSIILELKDESYLGEDNKMHTKIYVEREDILSKVALISEDWLEQIKHFGGVAYLDNIMTVKENGVNLGKVNADGSYEGEVYDTYEGIAGARSWSNPKDLKQYFGRRVALEPDEQSHVTKPEEIKNTILNDFYNYKEGRMEVGKIGELYSDEHEVSRAIPVNEDVFARGEFSSYGYNLGYTNVTGSRTYGVRITVNLTLCWTEYCLYHEEDEDCSKDISFDLWYDIQRPYQYYKADYLNLYELADWSVENAAIDSFTVKNKNLSDVKYPVKASITDPLYRDHIEYDAGDIDGGNHIPDVPEYNLFYLADAEVGDIITTSDTILINGETIIDEYGVQHPKKEHITKLEKSATQIKEKSENIVYKTESFVTYAPKVIEGIKSTDNKEIKSNVLVNPINIHTPVICEGRISDDIWNNQRIFPDKDKKSLVLGEYFEVFIDNEGEHIDEKGYEKRNYNKYVLDNEVRFPFDVSRSEAGEIINAGTWIGIGKNCENNKFYLPIYVKEKDYKIDYRTRAINENIMANTDDKRCHYANYNRQDYMAVNEIMVNVSGRLEKFTLVGSNDLKIRDLLTLQKLQAPKLPLKTLQARQGYEFEFEITTVGDKSEELRIIPHFYFVKEGDDYDDAYEVDVYRLFNKRGEVTLEKLGAYITLKPWIMGNEKKFLGRYKIDKDVLVLQKGYDLETLKDTYGFNRDSGIWENYEITNLMPVKSGYIIVNFEIESLFDNNPYLSYENPLNYPSGYCNKWLAEREGKYIKRFGDIILYYGNKNYMEDYVVVGTH